MTKCIENCEACNDTCEGYGYYDSMSVAENNAVKELEEEIFELGYTAHLTEQAYSHTEKEMDEEFYQPIKRLKNTLHQLKGFLGTN